MLFGYVFGFASFRVEFIMLTNVETTGRVPAGVESLTLSCFADIFLVISADILVNSGCSSQIANDLLARVTPSSHQCRNMSIFRGKVDFDSVGEDKAKVLCLILFNLDLGRYGYFMM